MQLAVERAVLGQERTEGAVHLVADLRGEDLQVRRELLQLLDGRRAGSPFRRWGRTPLMAAAPSSATAGGADLLAVPVAPWATLPA